VPPLKVICPKCFKGQQVVGEIPRGGVDHVCLFCKTTFRVKPPAHPSSEDLPAPREAIPHPGDLPAPREAIPRPEDLPAPREAVPKPEDLPVPRETVPKPGDLPAPRDAVPRPSDLPIDRDAVPRPSDLPIAREAVPRPSDLPIARETVPRPGDLPIDRDAIPRPGDLPLDRDTVPRPGDLPIDRNMVPNPSQLPVAKGPSFGPNLPISQAGRPPTKTPPLGLALDLSFSGGDAPTGNDAFQLELPPPPAEPAPAFPPYTPPPLPPKKPGMAAPPPVPAAAVQQPRTNTKPLTPLAPQANRPEFDLGVAPQPTSEAETPLNLDDIEPAPASLRPSRSEGGTKPGGGLDTSDLGFSLELEGDARAASTGPAAIPFPSARVANEGMGEAAAAINELPTLDPPTNRGATAARALRPQAKKRGLPRWALFAAGGAVLAVAAFIVLSAVLKSSPTPDNVIRSLQPDLAMDKPSAYAKAAELLGQAATPLKEKGARLRAKASELILTAYLAHGGPASDIARAEQLLAGATPEPKWAAQLARAKALLAIAKGKTKEAEATLTDRAAMESMLVLALAKLADDKPAPAVDSLRRLVAAKPNDLLGQYLLGKSLAGLGSPDARKAFEAVLQKNPAHAGARIGLAKLEETPEKRLAAARALIDKKLADAGSLEMAELHLLAGQASQALGRTPEAADAFQRAIGLDKRLTVAFIALGESLLYEGKYAQALERLRAAGPALEANPMGKFALGGALIATNKISEGVALVNAAAKERTDDPRSPFWLGLASSLKDPPDLTAAEQGYRDAIKRDPKFLPASLRLAALLQREDKAQESLSVLRAAEEAGAPPAVLQLAWGEALIVAKEPDKAQEVFQKALDADPKSVSARLGIASALEAQNKLAEAKASLEGTLKEAPETIGLRERLAQVCLKLGDKPEALARYQQEIQAGHATPALRLAVARIALDLGKLELVQSEVKKVFEDSPRNAEGAYLMARVHEIRNEYTTAIQDYRHATGWGNTPEFSLDFGRLLIKIGKERDALPVLAATVGLADGRMERGRIYYRAGDLESALADFQAATKMSPNDAEPLLLQGLCYDKMGESSKAEDAYRAALRADPESPEAHYRLGRMALDRAKPSAAIDHLRKAAAKMPEQAPWRADVYFQLAQAELLTGSKSAALSGFKKFLELAPPDSPAVPEAEQQVKRLGGGGKVVLKSQ
jgi:tetratricopeptide (TPR) repeat protein